MPIIGAMVPKSGLDMPLGLKSLPGIEARRDKKKDYVKKVLIYSNRVPQTIILLVIRKHLTCVKYFLLRSVSL